MSNYMIDIHSTETQIVGKLNTEAIQKLTGVQFMTDEVYMYPGAIKHVKKRHPGIMEKYGHLIPDIINAPDYIGHNPKEPDSIEMVKSITPQLMLAVKLDPKGYLYVSTFFALKNGKTKIKKRLASKRLVKYVE